MPKMTCQAFAQACSQLVLKQGLPLTVSQAYSAGNKCKLWLLTNLGPGGTPAEQEGNFPWSQLTCRSDTSHVPSCSDAVLMCPEEQYSACFILVNETTLLTPLSLHILPNPTLLITFTEGKAAESSNGDPKAKFTAFKIVPHDGGNTGWQAFSAELPWLWAGVSWRDRGS